MAIQHYETFIIPSWARPYLAYGDASGLADSDVAEVDKWLKTLPEGYTLQYGEEDEFGEPDFGLACGTVECMVFIYLNTENPLADLLRG